MSDENKPQEADEAPKLPTYSAVGRTIVVKGSVSRAEKPPVPPKDKDKN